MFGAAISYADRQLNPASLTGSQRRMNGVAAILALLLLAVAAGFVFNRFFALFGLVGILLETGLVAIFLAQKSLADHVAAVAVALRDEGLAGGRTAVSRIVGRDPETLDEPAVCRAAIESLAENFSDGVVAPALWYAVFGLPGLFAYKMLNTADSMIGHKSEKYIDFGWAAARLDDVANWPAARLSILLIAAGAWIRRGTSAGREAIRVAMRDGALHRSPNSGRPEAAMAASRAGSSASRAVPSSRRLNSAVAAEGSGQSASRASNSAVSFRPMSARGTEQPTSAESGVFSQGAAVPGA